MRVFIKAKTGAKKEAVEKLSVNGKKESANFTVSVRERPIKGAANAAIIRALSKYLGISPQRIKIISGPTSKRKVLEIF